MSNTSKIGLYVLVVLLGGTGVIVVGLALFGTHVVQPVPLLIIGLLLLAGAWCFLREITRFSVVVDEQSLTVVRAFTSRSELLDDIAGYRSGNKNAILLELKRGGRPLTVPGSIGQRDEMVEWLREKFPDIDAQRADAVQEEVIHDERFGLTEEDRKRRLLRAWKLMAYSTLVTLFFIAWVIVYPHPFEPMMLIFLGVPLVAVWLTWYYKGLLRLYFSKTRPFPTLLVAVVVSEFAAFFALLWNYNIYSFVGRSWELVLGAAVVVAIVWAMACWTATAGEKNLFAIYGGLLLVASLYGYDAIVFANCAYDRQPAVIWRVGVKDKHVSRGRSTTYYVRTSHWGKFRIGNSVQVSSSFYRSVAEGDSINVYLHPGIWGIPWYELKTD